MPRLVNCRLTKFNPNGDEDVGRPGWLNATSGGAVGTSQEREQDNEPEASLSRSINFLPPKPFHSSGKTRRDEKVSNFGSLTRDMGGCDTCDT